WIVSGSRASIFLYSLIFFLFRLFSSLFFWLMVFPFYHIPNKPAQAQKISVTDRLTFFKAIECGITNFRKPVAGKRGAGNRFSDHHVPKWVLNDSLVNPNIRGMRGRMLLFFTLGHFIWDRFVHFSPPF